MKNKTYFILLIFFIFLSILIYGIYFFNKYSCLNPKTKEDYDTSVSSMLCIGKTCITEENLIQLLFKSQEKNIPQTVIYSKSPLVRNTEGKDLSTPADIKRMLPNGGIIYSEEIGPITFRINSENEAFYTIPQKYQLWATVYNVSLDMIYQSQEMKNASGINYNYSPPTSDIYTYAQNKNIRYMKDDNSWMDIDPLNISYIRYKGFKNAIIVYKGNDIELLNKYIKTIAISEFRKTDIISDIPNRCGPQFGKCANNNECCDSSGYCSSSNCTLYFKDQLAIYNNLNIPISTTVTGSPPKTKCGSSFGKCAVGECCDPNGICSSSSCSNTKNTITYYGNYSNPTINLLFSYIYTSNNNIFLVSNTNYQEFKKEFFCYNILENIPSKIKEVMDKTNINRIFGFSDSFNYTIDGITYTTPSNVWMALKTSNGDIYEGIYLPNNYLYNYNELTNDPLSLLTNVRRKANLINDVWGNYENIPSRYVNLNLNILSSTELQYMKQVYV